MHLPPRANACLLMVLSRRQMGQLNGMRAVHVLLRDPSNAASAHDSTVLLKKVIILTALWREQHLPECLFAYQLPPYFEGIN